MRHLRAIWGYLVQFEAKKDVFERIFYRFVSVLQEVKKFAKKV